MLRPGSYKYLKNSELAYYFAGGVACQPLYDLENPETDTSIFNNVKTQWVLSLK